MIDVFVKGTPAPQGSKRLLGTKNGKSVAVESSKAVKPWRTDIRDAITDELGDTPALDGPLVVWLTFVMPRPKSHYRTGRNAHLLRDSAPRYPAGIPDADKLARAVLDAVSSAEAWRDDCQVVALHAFKVYPQPGEPPGARITIKQLDRPTEDQIVERLVGKADRP